MWWVRVMTSCVLLLNQLDFGIPTEARRRYLTEPRVTLKCKSPRDLMTDSVKQSILSNLNFQRRRVAAANEAGKFPVAFPMSDLVWDDTLAENAKTVAMNCPLVALVFFNTTVIDSEKIGQGIAIKIWDREPLPGFQVDELLVRFSSAAARMTAEKNSIIVRKYQSGDWDAGYQIIWEKTKKVGCSYVSYKNGDPQTMEAVYLDSMMDMTPISKNITFKALVCNYSPAGCVPGEQVYRIKIEPLPTKKTSTTTRKSLNCSPVLVVGRTSTFPLVVVYTWNILSYYMNE